MKCPFCAESIKDEAVLCRFCGARKEGQTWNPPQPQAAQAPAPGNKGAATIRLAGVLFILSAVYELATVTSQVPLAGAMRSGALAVIFHLLFVAMFAAMGAGLLVRKPWGFWTTIGATAFYTLERAVFLFDGSTKEAYLRASLGDLSAYRDIIDPGMIKVAVNLEVALVVACWWGFALYVYVRRTYFGIGIPEDSGDSGDSGDTH